MALTRWRRPGDELARVERRIRRMFDEPFRLDLFAGDELGWTPPVEITDTPNSIELAAELPGMTKDDVEISLQNNVLTIRGEKKELKETDEKERYLFERFYGSFQRAFSMPVNVDEGAVTAEFMNGVLRIHLPKAPEAKGRMITIEG